MNMLNMNNKFRQRYTDILKTIDGTGLLITYCINLIDTVHGLMIELSKKEGMNKKEIKEMIDEDTINSLKKMEKHADRIKLNDLYGKDLAKELTDMIDSIENNKGLYDE